MVTLHHPDRNYSNPLELGARSYKGLEHTMPEDDYKDFIGRKACDGLNIKTKKFSPQQVELLQKACPQRIEVLVQAAYREDLELLAQQQNCEVLINEIYEHVIPGKNYYSRKQKFALVRKEDGEQELWVLVFPSFEYVDQIAELIVAIFADFDVSTRQEDAHRLVRVRHHPALECSISDWTGFNRELPKFIGFGEVVVVGNIDDLLPGLVDFGFEAESTLWVDFGLDGMFSRNTFYHKVKGNRLVCIRVVESFWGSASGQYCRSLVNCGARHIMYGSKAATAADPLKISQIFNPNTFYLVNESEDVGPPPKISLDRASDIDATLKLFGIGPAGAAVTLPTVVGETKEQRENYYTSLNPACIDCENGHIAHAISDFNDEISVLGKPFDDFAKFVPVHYISDYIYRMDEEKTRDHRYS